jgi:hypothetical protein
VKLCFAINPVTKCSLIQFNTRKRNTLRGERTNSPPVEVKGKRRNKMVKIKDIKVGKTVEQLEVENRALNERVALLQEQGKVISPDSHLKKYIDELEKIKGKAKVGSDKIVVTDITDHKNISLWRKDGKRIGPLHRENAIKALQTFYNLGVMLSTDRPTEAEIAEYKETDEYKAQMAALAKVRARKNKSLKSGSIDKLTAAIAKLTGLPVDQVTDIDSKSGMLPIKEGLNKIK